jgi:cytochrome c-type biogenesis protein CcmH/NrfF
MTKTRFLLGSMLLLLVLGLVLAACSGAQEPAAGSDLDGKALTEERCTQCHNLQTVTSAKKSRDAWQSTVERMIGKGAELNDAEKAAVIDYLTEAYPE